jgi:hypothetical protein
LIKEASIKTNQSIKEKEENKQNQKLFNKEASITK